MKWLVLVVMLAVGCSKVDVIPNDALAGNWSFKSSTISGDFTIINTSNGYSLRAGGTFSINGKSYPCDQFWMPRRSTGSLDIYLGSPMINNSREAMLIFSINPSGSQYSLLQVTDAYYELKNSSSLVPIREAFILHKN
jgi:hypothetical protein